MNEILSNKEVGKAIRELNKHDGYRYQATIYFISRMSDGDLQIITDFCIKQERKRYNKIKLNKRTKED